MPDLNNRELGTVLAALRFGQRLAVDVQDEFPEDDIAMDGGMEALTAAEIDELCERLNTEPTERVTIDFNALSCAAQGYSRLTAEQKGHLASVAADIFLTNLVFTRAVTKAFREAADRLDYQSEGAAEDFATLEENSNA